MAGHARHAPHVDADRREGAPRAGPPRQPLVAGPALPLGARTDDLADSVRRRRVRARVRLRRAPTRSPRRGRRAGKPDARAAHGRRLLQRDDGRVTRRRHRVSDLDHTRRDPRRPHAVRARPHAPFLRRALRAAVLGDPVAHRRNPHEVPRGLRRPF